MKKSTQAVLVVTVMVVLLLGIVAVYFIAFGPTQAEPLTATLMEFKGGVQVMVSAGSEWILPSLGVQIEPGGQVATGEDGRARVDLSNGTVVRIAPNTYFNLTSLENTDDGPLARVRLGFGQIWIVLRGGALNVDTNSGVASVRGSYMSVSVSESGQVYITCLEGDCQLETEAGVVSFVAGQTAAVSNINEVPSVGVMTDEEVMEWLNINPEATMVIPAVTATVGAGLPDVPLPPLACLQDGSCQSYCTPPGWDPVSGTVPPLDQVPEGCLEGVFALMWQDVDPLLFINCVALGGDPQICANSSVRQAIPLPNDGSISVTLPSLACLQTGDCAAYCNPTGYDPYSGQAHAIDSIPPDCLDAVHSLALQGVDPRLFYDCVISGGDPQTCANSSVVR